MGAVAVEPLEWDSEFWGFPVARVPMDAADDVDSGAFAASLDRHLVVQALVDLARVDSTGRPVARTLAAHGFFPVDSRLEYELPLDAPEATPAWREGTPPRETHDWSTHMDPSEVRGYAEQLLPQSRFRAFPVPDARVVDFYRIWIEKAQAGTFDDGLLHLTIDGDSAGFVSTRLREGVLIMGLLVVAPPFRGRGVLELLLEAMIVGARARGARVVTMATEGINLAARRAFAREGFRLVSDTLWMYRVR